MKRSLWVVGLTALLACAEEDPAPPAQMSGVNDVVAVGSVLFITSTNESELRALSLIPRSAEEDARRQLLPFVRAPNPLEPLRIPVLARPSGLAKDLGFSATGEELAGDYVYAISEGSPEVSVVWVAWDGGEVNQLDGLVEQARFREPAAVTAVAARTAGAGLGSELFVATYDGAAAQLTRRTLPAPDALSGAQVASTPVTFTSALPIVALAVLPNPNELAVATRGAFAASGSTVILDVTTGATRPMQFPVPVRMLVTHPTFSQLTAAGSVTVNAGTNLFAILDEAACALDVPPAPCRGILAVNTATGTIAPDVTGAPMLPLSQGTPLVRGLALGRSVPGIKYAGSPEGTEPFGLLGMYTVATGQIVFFDAGRLRQLDARADDAKGTVTYRTPGGAVITDTDVAPLPVSLTVSEGAARTEALVATYEGIIPGFESVAATVSGDSLVLPAGSPVSRAQPGDSLLLTTEGASCLTGTLVVAAVVGETFTVAPGAIPPACTATPKLTLRAADGTYVLTGSNSGLVARLTPDVPFSAPPSEYYYHSDDFIPLAAPPPFTLTISSYPSVARDGRFEMVIDAAFQEFVFAIAGSGVEQQFAQGIRVPGSIAYDNRPESQGAFVAYPASEGVLQIRPANVIAGAENGANQNILSYR